MVRRMLAWLFVTAASVTAVFAQPPQEPAREQYVPIDQLPPSEQMPSAPLVVAAYSVVWLVAMFYAWTIWRRIGKVEDDMLALARKQKDAGR
ncbi:MAG: hypothetical protein A3H97_02130 [Acidobacteria bacterium RIFCSPLOWO2_02_FULL_65_29]|nr:MAG: hypothetical protein A3H97_02130 [Acidobacteria bacterium RIFCSPLOWO2_02_FULL_65_29]